jgi:hypothetical protein
MTAQLPDPRRYASSGTSPLLQRAEVLAGAAAAEQPRLINALAGEIAALLENADDPSVREAMLNAPSAQAARALNQALDAALNTASRGDAVSLHMFALPVLLVVGANAAQDVASAQSAQRLLGVLPEPQAIHALFEEAGVLGHCRNFGISNALTSLENMQAVALATLYKNLKHQQWNDSGIDMPPAQIDVAANRETVHLRFIYGAALTPASAPAFVESAGDIGRWGIKLTKELGRQLTTPDVSLLAIPRAPRSLVRAMDEGWFAVRELGFQLFLSNALRQARMRIGEPDVSISAATDQTIRIRLTSPFDDLLDQTYGWPLAPEDDFDKILGSIAAMLEEVKIERIRVVPEVEQVASAKREH